jgi:membrane glycosyltransferase
MYLVVAVGGVTILEWPLLVLFSLNFSWIAIAFSSAVVGFVSLLRGINDSIPAPQTLTERTAVIMPIYNEDVTRVFEGLRAIYLSLQQTGQDEQFDFFVLSDSDDPSKWIEEEVAWLELCRQLKAFGRIFYRKRRKPINRKSGNVSDFCRRWGKRYRYTVVLDADSLMSGRLLTTMVRIMEKNSGLGILQTFPRQIAAETLLGRVMQFAQALYGPPFAYGLDYWQCGEASRSWGRPCPRVFQPVRGGHPRRCVV